MTIRHSIVVQLAFAALFFSAQADPQEQNLPLDLIHKGIDPEKVFAAAPTLKITDTTAPEVVSMESVHLQGVGRIQRIKLRYSVTVTNISASTENFRIRTDYRIATEMRSAETAGQTSSTVIGSGQTISKTVEFSANLRRGHCYAGPTTVYIDVLDKSGAVADQEQEYVHMGQAMARARPRVMPAVDLGITRIQVGRGDGGTRTVVHIQNTGIERWGYPASLTALYSQGRPGNLRPIGEVSSTTSPIDPTRMSRPCEAQQIRLDPPQELTPGYIYTVEARISGRDDQVAENNVMQTTFIVESDGRINPVTE